MAEYSWDRVVDVDPKHDLDTTVAEDTQAVKNLGGRVTQIEYPNDDGNLRPVGR